VAHKPFETNFAAIVGAIIAGVALLGIAALVMWKVSPRKASEGPIFVKIQWVAIIKDIFIRFLTNVTKMKQKP